MHIESEKLVLVQERSRLVGRSGLICVGVGSGELRAVKY